MRFSSLRRVMNYYDFETENDLCCLDYSSFRQNAYLELTALRPLISSSLQFIPAENVHFWFLLRSLIGITMENRLYVAHASFIWVITYLWMYLQISYFHFPRLAEHIGLQLTKEQSVSLKILNELVYPKLRFHKLTHFSLFADASVNHSSSHETQDTNSGFHAVGRYHSDDGLLGVFGSEVTTPFLHLLLELLIAHFSQSVTTDLTYHSK